jgi:hypothetical protein
MYVTCTLMWCLSLISLKLECTAIVCAGLSFSYVQSVNKYYKLIMESMNWDAAAKTCSQFSSFSHLAMPQTAADMAEIQAIMSDGKCETKKLRYTISVALVSHAS